MATQIRFQQISGSFPAASKSETASSGMSESAHGSLGDTLNFLASSIKRIHGNSDWANVGAGIFAHTLKPSSDGGADLGTETAEWAALRANAVYSAAGLTISGSGNIDVDATGSGKLLLDGAGGIDIGTAANVAVDFNSAAFDLDAAGAITIDGTSTLSIDVVDDSNLTVTASGKDLDIAVAGGGAQELRIASAGTGASALHLSTSTGGINVDSADMLDIDVADEITIDTTSADGHIAITSAHTAGQSILISANAAEGSILDVDAGTMDVDVQAGFTLDASGVSLDSDAASNFSTSAGDLTLDAAAGSVNLTGGEADAAAVRIQADASAGGIDIDAGTAGIAIDTTGGLSMDAAAASNLSVAGANLTLATTSSGNLVASSAATVDIDGVAIDIDGTGAMTLDTSDTSNGIKIGTGTSGVPITLGHGTSEVTVADNLTVSGDLTVSGTTTTVNSTVTTLADPLIVLAHGASGSPANDLGLVLKRGSSNSMGIIFDESDDTFKVADIGSEDGTTAGNISSVTPTNFMAGKLMIDSAADSIDVDTDLKVVAAADIVLDPGGNNVVPGSDSADSLGKAATSASHSAGSSASSLLSNLSSGQSFNMNTSQSQAILYGSSLSAGSASSFSDESSLLSALGSVSLSSFSSSPSGTLSMGSYSGGTISAGTILVFSDSGSNKFFFVVVADYSGGSSLQIHALTNISGHTTSLSSVNSIQELSYSAISGSGLSSVSASAGATVAYTDGSSNKAVFVLVTAIGSSNTWGFVADPRDDLSDITSFSSSSSFASATAGGSVTAAADAVAWANLYVDDIDLNGQGSISMGGSGRIDLDADDDTSIRASADDVITFEVGGSDRLAMNASAFEPSSDDGMALGSANKNFSDLFLADAAVLNFGDDQDVTMTHDGSNGLDVTAAGGLDLDSTAGSMTVGASLADGQTLKLGKNGAVEMIFTPHGTAGNEKFSLTNTAGTAADAIALTSTAGGIDLSCADEKTVKIDQSLELVNISEPSSPSLQLYSVSGVLHWNGAPIGVPVVYRHVMTADDVDDSGSGSSRLYTFVGGDRTGDSDVTFTNSTVLNKVQVYLNGQLQFVASSGGDCSLTSTSNRVDFGSTGSLAADDILQVIVYA